MEAISTDHTKSSADEGSALRRTHATTPQVAPSQRKYDIVFLDQFGAPREYSTISRAHSAFEDVFNVFTGALTVRTPERVVSVEDIMPGDQVLLSDGSYDTLLWKGRTSWAPGCLRADGTEFTLTRFAPSSLDKDEPAKHVILGQSARILHRSTGIQRVTGADGAFIPASDFQDAPDTSQLRPKERLSTYQLGFATERAIPFAGLSIASLHPGTAFNLGLRGEALREYLSLFPHKTSFQDFGLPLYPRLRRRDLDLLS